jgi:hypothetical protein
MKLIRFPFLVEENVGRNGFLKWKKFYKIRQEKRNCWTEEGLWRRTQEKINAAESGWKRKNDKRRRMIHYEHEFDVLKRDGIYSFYLTSVYVWLHLCLSKNEVEQYFGKMTDMLDSGGWQKRKSQKSNESVFENGDLLLEMKKRDNHQQDVEVGRMFPSNYTILEIVLRSKGTRKSAEFQKKPWLVLKTGIRKKDKRGRPKIVHDMEKLLPFLPAQVEIGGGASIESGIFPLHFLHSVYSVSDNKKKFVFSFEKDEFVQTIAKNPAEALKKFSAMHKRIFFFRPNSFYEKLVSLHKKKYIVGPIITNNFDGFVRQVGLNELYVRRYDDNIIPNLDFDKKAKSLIVVGVHADRRRIQRLARNKGLKVIYIDPEGYVMKDGRFAAYLLESPQNEDIIISENATLAFEKLERFIDSIGSCGKI